jgi:hemerythrin-like domain-containing protein
MPRALEQLRQDHRNTAVLLDFLERQISVFDTGERPDYDLIEMALDYFLTYPDLRHHPLEDRVYREIAKRDPAAARQIGNLIGEHERLRELTRRVNSAIHAILNELEVSREAVDHLVRDFIATYRRHIAAEDETFFPVAADALSEADWARIDAGLEERADPLFGKTQDQLFESLRRHLELAAVSR